MPRQITYAKRLAAFEVGLCKRKERKKKEWKKERGKQKEARPCLFT